MCSKERTDIYEGYRKELLKRQLSNNEAYDKAVLSLSSAGLAISLTLFDKVLPDEGAEFVVFLYVSWILFAVAIVFTIMSFLASQQGIKIQLKLAERYYINHDESALETKNWAASTTEVLNWTSGLSFILAIFFFITLGIVNFDVSQTSSDEVYSTMAKKTETRLKAATIPNIPKIQKRDSADVKDGATIPTMPTTTGEKQESILKRLKPKPKTKDKK